MVEHSTGKTKHETNFVKAVTFLCNIASDGDEVTSAGRPIQSLKVLEKYSKCLTTL